ncbi:pancreatic lipase-related protein 2 isoform X1 [Rhagoletis pomonella]|uniref:pancreatic lipase-related protein 2 isoform X1 n=2 Tax=Rhagoletis pomonella TaxID=28610 RepID=UPI001785E8D7|nr:pancreatic lipase-related protein 2 isoform X1 [Rhagoletis pomonella]
MQPIRDLMLIFIGLAFLTLPEIYDTTFLYHHIQKWKAMATSMRYIQETMLRTSLNRAKPNLGIVFECRTTSNMRLGDEYHFDLQLGDLRGFHRLDPRRKLALFLHGWNDEGSKEWVQDMLKTWTHFDPNYSVCVVDWGNLSKVDYKTASMSIFDVGLTVAGIIKAMENLRPNQFTRRNVTLAGYSLGAHAAGYAGVMLNGEVEQIIGLDPAGPLFTLPAVVSTDFRLDPSDAEFVQVLHTSGDTLGTSVKSGHADFYPNGGKAPQRHCQVLLSGFQNNAVACSHSSSAVFFKQSMNPAFPFVGYHCSSYENFEQGLCAQSYRGRFGIHSQRRNHGDFYFDTESQPPYVQRRQWQQRWLHQQRQKWRRRQRVDGLAALGKNALIGAVTLPTAGQPRRRKWPRRRQRKRAAAL